MTFQVKALAILASGLLFGSIAAQAQTTDTKPIKIGILSDMSSLYADQAGLGSVEAAKMAAEDAGGKIGNRPIEIVFADHQHKTDVATNDRAALDRCGRRRRHRRHAELGCCACGAGAGERQEQDRALCDRRHHRTDRQAVLAKRHSVGLRRLLRMQLVSPRHWSRKATKSGFS